MSTRARLSIARIAPSSRPNLSPLFQIQEQILILESTANHLEEHKAIDDIHHRICNSYTVIDVRCHLQTTVANSKINYQHHPPPAPISIAHNNWNNVLYIFTFSGVLLFPQWKATCPVSVDQDIGNRRGASSS